MSPITSRRHTVYCSYIRYVTGYSYSLTSYPTGLQAKTLKSRSAGTQFDIPWPLGRLKILAVISTGGIMFVVQLLFTVCVLVWHRDDGDSRRERKIWVNNNDIWYSALYVCVLVGLLHKCTLLWYVTVSGYLILKGCPMRHTLCHRMQQICCLERVLWDTTITNGPGPTRSPTGYHANFSKKAC